MSNIKDHIISPMPVLSVADGPSMVKFQKTAGTIFPC